jgi:thiopeptide-type bacteriocin biosynthesis protein
MVHKQIHIPGEEWFYLKIYSGQRTADGILKNIIRPFSEGLLAEGLAGLWFFIRYYDPDFHIRYRVRLRNKGSCDPLLNAFQASLQPVLGQGMVWKVEMSTYRREIERYGRRSMEYAEQLFFYDSQACLESIMDVAPEADENSRWLFALASADRYLSDFGYELNDKKELMLRLSRSFGEEFGKDRYLARQLSDRYRMHRQHIAEVIERREKEWLCRILDRRSLANRQYIEKVDALYHKGEMEIVRDDLVASLIHMSMNRIFANNGRLHEMVIYDLLFRHYKSALAREGKAEG